MNATLRENIDWVGYVDWNVRDFHGYNTARGATYNAYLIRDEKTALIDTVKGPYAETLLANISKFIPFDKIDYLVCNHAETDHAGSMGRVLEACPQATVVCDRKCRDVLGMHFDTSRWKFHLVETGDTLALGKRSLQFIETPMVHWPESMFTYLPEEKLLFSMDAFGQHYASSHRFDDQVDLQVLMEEAKTYYANIVMPFGKQVAGVLERAAGLEIEMVAPAHGIIWRSHISEILSAYRDWAVCKPRPKVLVIYDSMWESTTEMARAILEGASLPEVEAVLIHIRSSSLTRIATEVLDTAAVAFGSSTLNGCMMPMQGAVLTYLKGLRPVGKAGFAFGSYGWGAGGSEAIDKWLKENRWEILREPLKARYRPTPEVLEECRAAGKMLAEKAMQTA